MTIKVMIVDDSAVMREVMQQLLALVKPGEDSNSRWLANISQRSCQDTKVSFF